MTQFILGQPEAIATPQEIEDGTGLDRGDISRLLNSSNGFVQVRKAGLVGRLSPREWEILSGAPDGDNLVHQSREWEGTNQFGWYSLPIDYQIPNDKVQEFDDG